MNNGSPDAAPARFRLTDPIDAGFVREFQQRTLAQPASAEIIDKAVEESLKVPARVWRAALGGCVEDDFVADMARIEAPTLGPVGRSRRVRSAG